MVVADIMLLPAALWSAIVLRQYPATPDLSGILWVFPVLSMISVLVFARIGLYRAVVRYMEDKAVFTVFVGVLWSSLALVALTFFTNNAHVLSRATYILYGVLALLYVGGSRMVMRGYLRRLGGVRTGTPVAIYGAGRAGVELVQILQMNQDLRPVALFDDAMDLQGSEVCGVKVYEPAELPEIVVAKEIRQVLLAIPGATHKQRHEIIERLERLHLQIKTIPSLVEIANGKARIDEFRQISIEDLLGRDPVAPDSGLISACIQGKSVMVTGAGGSIGSELCRQVLAQHPARLVLFELSEYALYSIEQELRGQLSRRGVRTEVVPILGSVTNRCRMEEILRGFRVQTIYHAAAYKHVPLVEHNLVEGVSNNVLGTWRTAEAARATGVETFILISTDKAVRPTNIMGASKRLSELVLQGLAREQEIGTRYCMVRFGNVLGSSGSVVPLFQQQIRSGGPLTVTHPEITRYFMTIPEAAQLVIQAGALGDGGEIFVLDMGSPVRILDLARKMVHLSGYEVRDELHPNGDIEIAFSGLRPGEKLYEELLIGNDVTGTPHPLIMQAKEPSLSLGDIMSMLVRLDAACQSFDCGAVQKILFELVEGYTSQNGIQDFLWNARRGHGTGPCKRTTIGMLN